METKKTNKDVLVKGIKTMGVTVILMFLGPTLFYIGVTNSEKPLYIPLLIAAIVACILAIYFGFKGLKTIMDSIFKN
ncbi:MAG: DUF6095 family protein [Psychroserpens sp.]|uniref:DUF6095 family protein n=1 Tax=Psychroserpens sp. TaxID=2020870 RepID=UPI003C738640